MSNQKSGYLQNKDTSDEEFESLIREIYNLWKRTDKKLFDIDDEESVNKFFNDLENQSSNYLINLKLRAKKFGLENVLSVMKQFNQNKLLSEIHTKTQKKFPEIKYNDSFIKKYNIPDDSRLTQEQKDIQNKVKQLLIKFTNGPDFIPLTFEDLKTTYEQMKKHSKI